MDARRRARGAALHRRLGRAARRGWKRFEAARDGETFEVGDGLQGQAWARRLPIWASGLEDDPLFRRGAAAEAAGVRVRARDADRARPRGAGHDHVLLARAAGSGSRLGRLLQTIGAHLAQFLERRSTERALAERDAEVDDLLRVVAGLQRP